LANENHFNFWSKDFDTIIFHILKGVSKLDRVVHASNFGTWETEAGRSGVQGQLGLHNEMLSPKEGGLLKFTGLSL
jgi:hypothetical protein